MLQGWATKASRVLQCSSLAVQLLGNQASNLSQHTHTHSTAESELVGYCESLLIGRATEALLCAMWGDNMAAIGLARGNTCSSWRTRHLRIRASILREAMEENCEMPGGFWRLTHLKGMELVADGLTKQLLGQSFERFREDLGLQKSAKREPKEKAVSTSTTMRSSAAVRVLTAGSAWCNRRRRCRMRQRLKMKIR